MAKKQNGLLDDLMDALGAEGSDILEDVVGELLGGEGLLDGIGDLVEDLTGIGATNTKASATAQKTGATKSSSSGKKVIKKTTAAKKPAKTTAKPAAKAKTKSSSAKKKIIP